MSTKTDCQKHISNLITAMLLVGVAGRLVKWRSISLALIKQNLGILHNHITGTFPVCIYVNNRWENYLLLIVSKFQICFWTIRHTKSPELTTILYFFLYFLLTFMWYLIWLLCGIWVNWPMLIIFEKSFQLNFMPHCLAFLTKQKVHI